MTAPMMKNRIAMPISAIPGKSSRLSSPARQQARAKAVIRRMKSIRDMHDPEARTWHRAILKELARFVAHPTPDEFIAKESI